MHPLQRRFSPTWSIRRRICQIARSNIERRRINALRFRPCNPPMFVELIAKISESLLLANLELVTAHVSERRRFEIWLQGEIGNALRAKNTKFEAEKSFPGSHERCDFWANGEAGTEEWVELKLCVTNYCKRYTESATTQPITQEITAALRDFGKLRSVSNRYLRSLLLIAYPLPVNYRTHTPWQGHIERLSNGTSRAEEIYSTPVLIGHQTLQVVGYIFSV